ncbi:unnamed protein product [Linum trigynum]|uniref:CRAL/TRIO N-terminal domain-containing protein n=1 Tax=Linum trigynum TaxID=586398 RepID=A0AAV2GM77_9ROSI
MADEPPPSAAPPPPPPQSVVEELPVAPPPPPEQAPAAAVSAEDSSAAPPPEEEKRAQVEGAPVKAEVFAKSVVIKEEFTGEPEKKEKLKVPESLISFKEESNRVSDLSDSEKKALDEFKQLVQEALDSCSFTSPSPPPPPKEEIRTSSSAATTAAATEAQKSEDQSSNVSTEITPSAAEKLEEEATPAKEEPAAAAASSSSSAEVSIWGIPLLEDDRSDVVLLKFLRARDFKVKEAFTMLKNTIQWRKEFKIDPTHNQR